MAVESAKTLKEVNKEIDTLQLDILLKVTSLSHDATLSCVAVDSRQYFQWHDECAHRLEAHYRRVPVRVPAPSIYLSCFFRPVTVRPGIIEQPSMENVWLTKEVLIAWFKTNSILASLFAFASFTMRISLLIRLGIIYIKLSTWPRSRRSCAF